MAKDILLDENLDLVIDAENNDLAFGESSQQEMILVAISEQGEWKHDPLVGLGLRRRMKGNINRDQIAANIEEQAEYCRIKIKEVQVEQLINVFI